MEQELAPRIRRTCLICSGVILSFHRNANPLSFPRKPQLTLHTMNGSSTTSTLSTSFHSECHCSTSSPSFDAMSAHWGGGATNVNGGICNRCQGKLRPWTASVPSSGRRLSEEQPASRFFATCFNQRRNLLQLSTHPATTVVAFCYIAQIGVMIFATIDPATTSVSDCYNRQHGELQWGAQRAALARRQDDFC